MAVLGEALAGRPGAVPLLVGSFAAIALSDWADGRLARTAGRASSGWGIVDVAADVAFNAAALGAAAWHGLIGPAVAVGVLILGGVYFVGVRGEPAAGRPRDRLGHAAGVGFYVLVGVVVAHVAIGLPGPRVVALLADALAGYVVVVLGVRVGCGGNRSA